MSTNIERKEYVVKEGQKEFIFNTLKEARDYIRAIYNTHLVTKQETKLDLFARKVKQLSTTEVNKSDFLDF